LIVHRESAADAAIGVAEQPSHRIEERAAALGEIGLEFRIGRTFGKGEGAVEQLVVAVPAADPLELVDEVPIAPTAGWESVPVRTLSERASGVTKNSFSMILSLSGVGGGSVRFNGSSAPSQCSTSHPGGCVTRRCA
jgi:hypothetical protein